MGAARQEAPALKIENVSIRFGDFKAIKNVSTSVGKTKPVFLSGRTERAKQRYWTLSAERTMCRKVRFYFSAIRENGMFPE